jgi:hypothetical protein
MQIKNGMLILEYANCRRCNSGTTPSRVICEKCGGTGNGIRGGKGRCKKCLGMQYTLDNENRQVCDSCDGSYENCELETPFNFIKLHANDIPVKVIRDYAHRNMSFSEQYIGVGLFSCTDYGRHKDQNDEELIESAFHFEEGPYSTQGIKLIRSKADLRICDAIAVVTADQGYSVVPIFEEDE